jgi:hypothetical protein
VSRATPADTSQIERVFCDDCGFEFEAQSTVDIVGDLLTRQPSGVVLCPSGSCSATLNEVHADAVG